MKIGIMTLYYNNHNYGGQLQAYALCNFLNQDSDVRCEQISFQNKGVKKSYKSIKSLFFKVYQSLIHHNVMKRLKLRKKKFFEFEEEIPHSILYTEETIDCTNEIYDLVFAGSDQVWNLSYTDFAFFLGHIDPKKRCSYAASFGKDDLKEYQDDSIINILREYEFLTVREKNAKKFINSVGISHCEMVCDPTLLLKSVDWKRKISKLPELKNKKYMFVYLLGDSVEVRKKIKKVAVKEKIEIVYLPHVHFSYQRRDRDFADCEIYEAGPWEFLGLIEGASRIITDSFHCCVFSILFGKEFYAIDREEGKCQSTNNRIQSLLQEFDLKRRFVNSFEDIFEQEEIDYTEVSKKIDEYREKSISILKEFLDTKRE